MVPLSVRWVLMLLSPIKTAVRLPGSVKLATKINHRRCQAVDETNPWLLAGVAEGNEKVTVATSVNGF